MVSIQEKVRAIRLVKKSFTHIVEDLEVSGVIHDYVARLLSFRSSSILVGPQFLELDMSPFDFLVL